MTAAIGGLHRFIYPDPRARVTGDPQALIEDARARQRHRRRRGLVAVACLTAAVGGVYGGLRGSAGQPSALTVIQRGFATALEQSRMTLLMSSTEYQRPPNAAVISVLADLSTGNRRVGTSAGAVRYLRGLSYTPTPGSPLVTLRVTSVFYKADTWQAGVSRINGAHLTPVYVCSCDPFIATNEIDRHIALLGDQMVNGQPAFHIRITWMTPDKQAVCLNFWINRVTFLPVRENGVATIDYRWLPRTSANLAKLVVTAPTGFKHVSRRFVIPPSR